METLLILVPLIILTLIVHKTLKRDNVKIQEKYATINENTILASEINNHLYEIAKDTSTMTKAELIATLKWMQQLNIINHNQYNELYLKSLPYTKG